MEPLELKYIFEIKNLLDGHKYKLDLVQFRLFKGKEQETYGQLKANNFSNLEVTDTFFESHKLSKLAQEETEMLMAPYILEKKKESRIPLLKPSTSKILDSQTRKTPI